MINNPRTKGKLLQPDTRITKFFCLPNVLVVVPTLHLLVQFNPLVTGEKMSLNTHHCPYLPKPTVIGTVMVYYYSMNTNLFGVDSVSCYTSR